MPPDNTNVRIHHLNSGICGAFQEYRGRELERIEFREESLEMNWDGKWLPAIGVGTADIYRHILPYSSQKRR
jgi:hypothetical protein